MKKIISFVLILAIISIAFLGVSTETVSAKVKINKKKVTIRKTQTVKLKVNGTKKKVKWSSKNKSIATVSKKGIVKAKKVGTTKIIAKAGKKKYKCTVVVKELFTFKLKNQLPITYYMDYLEDYDKNIHKTYPLFSLTSFKFKKCETTIEVLSNPFANGNYDVTMGFSAKRLYTGNILFDDGWPNQWWHIDFKIYNSGGKLVYPYNNYSVLKAPAGETVNGETTIFNIKPGDYVIELATTID